MTTISLTLPAVSPEKRTTVQIDIETISCAMRHGRMIQLRLLTPAVPKGPSQYEVHFLAKDADAHWNAIAQTMRASGRFHARSSKHWASGLPIDEFFLLPK